MTTSSSINAFRPESLKACILLHWSRTFTEKGVSRQEGIHTHDKTNPLPQICRVTREPCNSAWVFCSLYSHRLSGVSRQRDSTVSTPILLQRKVILINWPLCVWFPTAQMCSVIHTFGEVSFLNRQMITIYYTTAMHLSPARFWLSVSESSFNVTLRMRYSERRSVRMLWRPKKNYSYKPINVENDNRWVRSFQDLIRTSIYF